MKMKTKIAFAKAAFLTTSFFAGGILSDLVRKHPIQWGLDDLIAVMEGAYFYVILNPDFLMRVLLLGKSEGPRTIDQSRNEPPYEMTQELKRDCDIRRYGVVAEYISCVVETTKERGTKILAAKAIAEMYEKGAGLVTPDPVKAQRWKNYAGSLSQ